MKKSEKEITIYAKIGNPAGLQQAIEIYDQEQAQNRAPNGRIRVRMERKRGNPAWDYTLTTKENFTSGGGMQDCEEDTEVINLHVYEMFKRVCDVFQRKVRYVFKVEQITLNAPGLTGALEVPELKYEVDHFITATGEFSSWCKIDVEIDALMEAMQKANLDTNKPLDLKLKLSSLPFQPTDFFMEDPNNPKSKELISAIFDKEFNRPVKPELAPATERVAPKTFRESMGDALIAAWKA